MNIFRLSAAFSRYICVVLFVAAALTQAGFAQTSVGGREEVVITRGGAGQEGSWHVVRPGETLRAIAERYLGSQGEWPRLHALNPSIENPNFIEPGQRLRILETAAVPPRSARLARKARKVEGQMTPFPWSDAEERTLLKAEDGVRTYSESSAELTFDDQTRLILTENSLVYIGGGGRAQRSEVEREMIEVVRGQADLESRKGSSRAEGIEIVLGKARAKPKAGNDGSFQTRLRMPEDGRAAFMVYGGESEVTAGGGVVKVEQGMGTTVAEGEPPAPPEKLLPAPRDLAPATGSEQPATETAFAWEPVAGAVAYTLEVCADPACAGLVARHASLQTAGLASPELPIGEHYWRVTAVSPSGLDGYPSKAIRFRTVEELPDREPPVISMRIDGPQITSGETLYTGPGFAIQVAVDDTESGVESWWTWIDGDRRPSGAVAGPWSSGPHTVVVEARDKAGNEARSPPLAFHYDPDPPVLRWGLRDGSARGSSQGVAAAGAGPVAPTQRWRRPLRTLTWSSPAGDWRELGSQEWTLGASGGPPALSLRPVRRGMRLSAGRESANESLLISDKRPIWLQAADEACGVENLVYRYLEPNPDTPPKADGKLPEEGLLVVEAKDRLGNLTRVEWPVWRAWFVD